MYQDLILKNKQVAVIGLGYVGLPLALEFAKYFKVIGFDINENRVKLMQQKVDPSNELSEEDFNDRDIIFTSNLEVLSHGSVFVIAVPTDIDEHKVPNLTPLKKASEKSIFFDYLFKGFHNAPITGMDVCLQRPLLATCSK